MCEFTRKPPHKPQQQHLFFRCAFACADGLATQTIRRELFSHNLTRVQLPHTHRLVRGKILCIGG
eukprot:2471577-Rhodomonas_salina.1